MSYPQGYLYQAPGSLALYSCPAYGASALAAPRSEELARSASGSAFSPYPGSAAFTAQAATGFGSPLQYSADAAAGFPTYMVTRCGHPHPRAGGRARSGPWSPRRERLSAQHRPEPARPVPRDPRRGSRPLPAARRDRGGPGSVAGRILAGRGVRDFVGWRRGSGLPRQGSCVTQTVEGAQPPRAAAPERAGRAEFSGSFASSAGCTGTNVSARPPRSGPWSCSRVPLSGCIQAAGPASSRSWG